MRELLAKHKVEVYGHQSDSARILGLTRGVEEGDEVQIGEFKGKVFFIPGHTTGHVAYLFENNLFCGDTLFTAGCGRLFEGTPEQMQASLRKLMALPDNTKIYCGHEYTESNLRFAMSVEPKNPKLVSRFERIQGLRARGASTVPRPWKRKNKPILSCAGTARRFKRAEGGGSGCAPRSGLGFCRRPKDERRFLARFFFDSTPSITEYRRSLPRLGGSRSLLHTVEILLERRRHQGYFVSDFFFSVRRKDFSLRSK